MIERQFVSQKIKEQQIQEYMNSQLGKTGYSHTEIQRTPLGEKVIIYTTRPGIVVGKKGDNIKRLTIVLKKKFKLENPQIEIGEIKNPHLDVNFIAEKIAGTLERFGSKRFKSTGYKVLQEMMDAGALGAEIIISGKVPSSRARSWRFSAGYLKKSGDISESFVHKACRTADIKSGTIGIRVKIMTKDIHLPDRIILKEEIKEETKQEIKEKTKEETAEPKKEIKEETKQETKEEKKQEIKEELKKETKQETAEPKEEIKKETKEIKETKKKDGNTKKERAKNTGSKSD